MITKRRKNRKSPSLFFSIFLGFFLLGMIALLVFSNFKITQRRATLITQIEELKKEIQILEEKNEELRAGISQSTKEIYWEERVREQGYKKPGEEAVVVLPSQEQEKEAREEESSFWNLQNWWGWIKNKIEQVNL